MLITPRVFLLILAALDLSDAAPLKIVMLTSYERGLIAIGGQDRRRLLEPWLPGPATRNLVGE